MNISCESIEYLPFSLEVECHYKKTYSVEVIKFKNLKIDNGGDLTVVEGKSYPFLLGYYNQFHVIPDICGQFEALNTFDRDILPFFISEGQRGSLIIKDHSIQEFIPYVYSNRYPITQTECFNILSSSVIFKEAYMIVDLHKMIPEEVYINTKSKLPEWYKDSERQKWEANSACLKIQPLVKQESLKNNKIYQTQILSDYSYNYDYFIRYGIEKFKEKVLSCLNRKENKSKGVYISRTKTTKAYSENFKNATDPKDIEARHKTFINRTYHKEEFFENYFKDIGYNVVYMEDLDYINQLEILLNTKNVVALHGSGLVNTFICDKDTNVYEIMLPVAQDGWWQNFFFLFSPIAGCMDDKTLPLSCIEDRRWKQIYKEKNAMNVSSWLKN